LTPSKAARFEAALLESLAAAAGAKVVSSEFLLQQFVTVDDPHAASDLRLGWEPLTPLAHRLEKNGCSLSKC
jgi:hypothetical protein